MSPARPRSLSIKERILRASKVDANGCWRWQHSVNGRGYGRINIKHDAGTTHTTAHRAAYMEFRGEIPAGHDIDHLCRVRDCVNPDHLEAVTRSENLRRSPLVGRAPRGRTHCVKGHPLVDANVIVRTSACGTRRFCRQCEIDEVKNCPKGRRQQLRKAAA